MSNGTQNPDHNYIYFKLVNNSADFAVSSFGYTWERSSVACLAVAFSHNHDRWISRAPDQLPNTYALVRIFEPRVWALVFAVGIFFSIFLVAASKIGRLYGMEFESYEDFLLPYRYVLKLFRKPPI